MTRQLTVGVIGHVDHGKTALVRALTGMETDRLPEEQRRGMSIVLGFAWLEHSGRTIDFIDAPGHERFVRTMVSGATGMDAAVLVIAANEGIKPQTREHLAIAGMLGIARGVIVITKTDLAGSGGIADSATAARELVAGTFLAGAPIIPTSLAESASLSRVVDALLAMEFERSSAPVHGDFFLPVDRVFSMAGHGTVVTGTLRRGELRADAEVEIQPAGLRVGIRQIQVHGRDVDSAAPGQRVAVNLRNVARDDIARGQALAPPGQLRPCEFIDAELTLLGAAERALRHGSAARLLTGTSDVAVTVRMLDAARVAPGERAIVQFRCHGGLATLDGERFILRADGSPVGTIGGGRILDARAQRHRRRDPAAMAALAIRAEGRIRDVVMERVEAAGLAGIGLPELAATCGCGRDALDTLLGFLPVRRLASGAVVPAAAYTRLLESIEAHLAALHQSAPLQMTVPVAGLRERVGRSVADAVFDEALHERIRDGSIVGTGGRVRCATHDPLHHLQGEARDLARRIEAGLRAGGMSPPDLSRLAGNDAHAAAVTRLLVDAGRIVILKEKESAENVALHTTVLEAARATLARCYPPPTRFTVAQARDALRSTRKFVLPLLAHFDVTGVTLRDGDSRQMRRTE